MKQREDDVEVPTFFREFAAAARELGQNKDAEQGAARPIWSKFDKKVRILERFHMKTLAIVPFRQGSRGIPQKNTRRIAGKPLWVHSVEAAQKAFLVDEIAITTDDSDAICYAFDELGFRNLDGLHLIKRPAELATDEAPLDAAIVHAVETLGFQGIIVTLQPTVPVRPLGLISRCITKLISSNGLSPNSVLTVNKLHFVWDGPVSDPSQINGPRVNRQDLQRPLYHEDGSVYATRSEALLEARSRIVDPVVLQETPRTVDIDDLGDLMLAEFLLSPQKRHGELLGPPSGLPLPPGGYKWECF